MNKSCAIRFQTICLNRHRFTLQYLLTSIQILWFGLMVFNATFNTISVISWRFCPLENLTTSTYVEGTWTILILKLTRNHQIKNFNVWIISRLAGNRRFEWQNCQLEIWRYKNRSFTFVVRVVLDIVTVIDNIHVSSKYHPKWAPVVERN